MNTTTILRLPQVKARTGISRSSIYLAISRHTFPSPIRLGARAVGWPEAAISAWIEARIKQSRKEGACDAGMGTSQNALP